jgi:hypothetical protein
MWGWILVISMAALALTALFRRSGTTPPQDDSQRLYPQGYMKDEVEALKRLGK